LTLRHHPRPGRDALIHEGTPEGLRVEGLGLRRAQHPEPRLAAFFHLLLPHVHELLTGVGHD
jgi:hypothetical protein